MRAPPSAWAGRSQLPEERRQHILARIRATGGASVSTLSELSGVSEMTIRRDLDELAAQKLVRRTRGGAVALPNASTAGQTGAPAAPETQRLTLIDSVQALILTPVSPKAAHLIRDRALQNGVPVVAEARGLAGATTLVAIDSFGAGVELGRWAGAHAREHFGGGAHALLVTAPFEDSEERSRGFAEGLWQELPSARIVATIRRHSFEDPIRKLVADALVVHPEINVIFGFIDEAALDALSAYRAAGLDERRVLLVNFGLEGPAGGAFLAAPGPRKAMVAMFPEFVGRAVVDAAVCAYNGVPLPRHVVTPTVVVTPESLDSYYRRVGDEWTLDLAAVEKVAPPGITRELLRNGDRLRRPARVGFIYSFGYSEWYQNVLRAARAHAAELGIELLAEDATEIWRLELEEMKKGVARAAARQVADGDAIVLDSGTTLTYLAQELRQRRNLTIITNSHAALEVLQDAQGLTILSTGGVLLPAGRCFVGDHAELALRNVRANKAFVSASGVSDRFGLSTSSLAEAAIKRAMIAAAKEVVLVVDHTKIGEEFLVQIAPLSVVGRLITDAGLGSREHLELNHAGIQVVLAEDPKVSVLPTPEQS